jgi:CubicO group peptidase (beta-lactamase class C family)
LYETSLERNSLAVGRENDADRDGIPDSSDTCPTVDYEPGFDWNDCEPMDQDPSNDAQPECKARERVVQKLVDPNDGAFITHMAFAVVTDGVVHFADAFTYVGQGQYEHDPDEIDRLYRVGSTTKSVAATAAKVLEENGELSLDDFVNDDDATQMLANGERTLGQLLSHQGAFKLDVGALHLFCYPQDLAAFWLEPDDHVSPHYDSEEYGNLGGGFEYSAFNYSLAGAYMVNRTGEPFRDILQTRIFDPAGMCTATLDGFRAANAPIGYGAAVSQAAVMHVGPYINLVSPTDERCEDNFYSSEDLPGDGYSYQFYRLDEAGAEARDPAGGVIASAVDMAHFAQALLASYNGTDGLISPEGVRDLWEETSDLMCYPDCPYEPYYGIGFFTNTFPGEPVTQVGHGGSRAGFTSGFVLRPEANLAVSVLANADAGTVALSELAKAILHDFEGPSPGDLDLDGDIDLNDFVVFAACMAGPAVITPPPGCDPAHFDAADLEVDGDVDMHDFSVFEQNFTGSQG